MQILAENAHRTFDMQSALMFRKAFGMDSLDDAEESLERMNMGLTAFHAANNGRMPRDPEPFLKSFYDDATVQDFLKTFESNSEPITNVLDLVGGAAMQVQSIDGTAVSLVEEDEDFEFLRTCERVDVTNTLLEYNTILANQKEKYTDAFVGESSDPLFDDPVLKRMAHNIAFLSAGYSHSRVLPLVASTENPESFLQSRKLITIFRSCARANWFGNRALRGVEYDGFQTILEDAGQVVDAEGSLLDLKDIKELSTEIRYPGFGRANQMWMSVGTLNEWDQYHTINDQERRNYEDEQERPIGHVIPGIKARWARGGPQKNMIEFRSDLWLDRASWTVPMAMDEDTGTYYEAPEGVNYPNPPAHVEINVSAGPVTGSKWKAGDVKSGVKVRYRIVAGNETGRSVATPPIEPDGVIEATRAMTLTMRPEPSGAKTTYFDVYRETRPGNGVFRYVQRIEREAATSVTSHQDLNEWRPGTDIAVLGDFNSRGVASPKRTYAMGVLLPPMVTKFPAGVIQLRKLGGIIETYQGLRVYAKKKFWLIKNLPGDEMAGAHEATMPAAA